MTKEISRWADSAMFEAEEMPFNVNESGPRVYLLQGTPDPLGSVAAFSAMYTGKVIRDKRDVTDEERRYHLEEMKKTKLKAPLEAVNLHWMVEGVTRSFTHQMVRQRTAVYAQESLRFAVKEHWDEEVMLPPTLAALPQNDEKVLLWKRAVNTSEDIYAALVEAGIPAEDARGLTPHAITTRLNYATNLRNFQDHAGNRLCTQAQFEWRMVWVRFTEAMRAYCTSGCGEDHDFPNTAGGPCDNWQWIEIANLFRPVCYITGQCEFKAKFDRACKIRDRVDANADINRPSSEWHIPVRSSEMRIDAISPAEWLLDDGAAR